MREVANWLCGPAGYQKLEDSYDVETYRRAYFAGPLDVESILHRFGRCHCQHQQHASRRCCARFGHAERLLRGL